jgi:hypothetical protein
MFSLSLSSTAFTWFTSQPPPMMYPPCLPWEGWYGPWVLVPMHFHLGLLGLAGGFDHEGCHAEDRRYGGVGQQQTR